MGKIVIEIEEFGKPFTRLQAYDQDVVLVGRGYGNDLILKDPFVAAYHAKLLRVDGDWVCEALEGRERWPNTCKALSLYAQGMLWF